MTYQSGSDSTENIPTKVAVLVGIVSSLVAVAYGISWGDDTSNHPIYLIDGLRTLDPGFLQYDWWATETSHYHHLFSDLVALLQRLGILKWGLVFMNLTLITVSLVSIFGLIRRTKVSLINAVFVWLIILSNFFVWSRSVSVASSNLFTAGLQPSTIGSAFYLIALYFFTRGAVGRSGICLGIAGAFHTNYLILALPFFGMALSSIRGNLIKNAAKLFAPTILILAWEAPSILHIIGLDQSVGTRETAALIFTYFAVPFHYLPRTFINTFIPFGIWNALALLPLLRSEFRNLFPKPLLAVYLSGLALITAATLLTTVTFVDSVSRLFVWRLAPIVLILAQVILAVSLCDVTRRVCEKTSCSVYYINKILLGVATMSLILAIYVKYDPQNYNLITVTPAELEKRELYDWARSTPNSSQFLIPPVGLFGFRLFSERAIVVDWKALPFRADEIVEWYSRLKDLSGLQSLESKNNLEFGYSRLDRPKMQALVSRYDTDYVVVSKDSRIALRQEHVLFENGDWVVFNASQLTTNQH